ncbi:uncharacterized protein [Palaemon carinicauda]|uniref:uncharacterized protein n=1 Tax=Palaemon carinicauda TaxID=392227 RepID=UPI0035B653F6
MGNTTSKKPKITDPKSRPSLFVKTINVATNEAASQDTASIAEKWEAWQRSIHSEVLVKMKEDFLYRPDVFLLNVLTLSVQFYQNFPKEKPKIFKYMRDREALLGKYLTQFQRRVLYPNGYEEISGSHILYSPEDDAYLELGNRQIYIIQENIKVFAEDLLEEVKNADKDKEDSIYRFCLESSNKHVGYVRLRSIDECRKPSPRDDIYGKLPLDSSQTPEGTSKDSGVSIRSECSSAEEDGKSRDEEEIDLLRKKLAAIDESSEEVAENDPPESDEAIKVSLTRRWSKVSLSLKEKYANSSDDHQPADASSDGENKNGGEEPVRRPSIGVLINPKCFTNRQIVIKKAGDVYGVHTQTETRTYLSSERYFQGFKDDFANLMEIMGKGHLLSDDYLELPASISTNEIMMEQVGPRIKTEFIPTVEIEFWPPCAFEWRLRERRTLQDPINKTIYRWPRTETIRQVTELGCNLVPLGHHSQVEPNSAKVIEWQIQFVKAERHLLKSLGHTQIRLLLIVEYLLRDHGQDVSSLNLQIYRHLIFWMCEHNFRDWQEERLGSKVKSYLKVFYNCLRKRSLPHYFIHKCNLLERVPEQTLRTTQVLVRNMLDNLSLFLMHTLTRMRTEDVYYDVINAEEIYMIVTQTKFTIKQILPKFFLHNDDATHLPSDSEEEDEITDLHHMELKTELHRIRVERIDRRRSKAPKMSIKEEQKPKSRRNTKSSSVIDLSPKTFNAGKIRSVTLMTLFINHFVKMASSSNEFECYSQAFMYHLVAQALADLLEDMNRKVDGELKMEICAERTAALEGIKNLLKHNWVMSDAGDIISTPVRVSGYISDMSLDQSDPASERREVSSHHSDSISSSESVEESHL